MSLVDIEVDEDCLLDLKYVDTVALNVMRIPGKTVGSRLARLCNLAVILLVAGLVNGAFFGVVPRVRAADPFVQRIQAVIKSRLTSNKGDHSLVCRNERLCGIRMLLLAYRKNNYQPMWLDASRRLEKVKALAEAIECAGDDGLVPLDYHLDVIYDLLVGVMRQSSAKHPRPWAPDLWADLELILTDAFLLYGSHLAAGRVNPETRHTGWKINVGAVDLSASLTRAAATGNIDAALAELRPAHRGYTALREALARLRRLADTGGWPVLDARKTLKPGDRGAAVGDLRHRLAIGGDIDPAETDDDPFFFDLMLASAVKRFQRSNGLKADGIVGHDTYGLLNLPIEARIRTVVLNLERWRWLPRDLGHRHILVNTAAFNLKAVEKGLPALQMRVVVGRPARRSPVFSANMTYLVINPFWNVPTTIAVKDMLPEIQNDVDYLARKGIRVYQNWEVDAPQIDPNSVTWQTYHVNNFPFKLRQDPGPNNALGRIKFMFPNAFAVYLHDTPNQTLFNRHQRDFSSGCIRVEAPFMLANFVLTGDDRWTPERIAETIKQGETRTIKLKQPVPLHLVYMTAWADEVRGVQFRSDLYNRDLDLYRALNQ